MKLLATRGRLEAAANLAQFLGTLDASSLTSGSPRRRRRKRRRKQSRRQYLAADMASEQHRQYRGQFDIKSMSKTIDLLEDLYSPMKTSPRAPKPLELVQPQGGLVSGRAPATLPAPQPPTSFSRPRKDKELKMTADAKQVEEILEGKPHVKEATNDNKVEEEVVDIKEGEERLEEETEVKEVKEKRIDEAEETLDEAVTMKEDKLEEKKTKQGWEVFLEQDEPATDDKVEEGVVDIKQGWEVFLEQNVLATDDKVEEEVVDIKQGEEHLERETNVKDGKEKRFDKAVDEKVVYKEDKEEVPPKPFHPRHQEQRLRFGHLGPSKVKSLGRWTSWTRDSLHSELDAMFSRPKRGVLWFDFSPEEKLAFFDMINWPDSCPDDPPSRSLMFEPESDCEAFLEQNWLTTDNKVEEEVELATQENEEETLTDDVMEMEEKVEVDDNQVTFSIEDLDYDYATGRLFIHLESGVVEVKNSQARDQLLAQMS